MSFPSDLLSQLSDAIASRAETAKANVVAVRLGGARPLTGLLWQPDIVVVSEQALPRQDEFELLAPGGLSLAAKLAGRDASTNIAILKTAAPIAAQPFTPAEAKTGTLALAIGADGAGGASARLGVVNLVGGEWHSRRGGLIDRRIVLGIGLGIGR